MQVQDDAVIVRSLQNLTRKRVTYHLGAEQEVAFGALKKALTTAPILAYSLAEDRMILDTDASNFSINIGAVLSQEQGQVERVISNSSRRLGPIQKRYCVN